MALIERQDIIRPVATRQHGNRGICQAEVERAVPCDQLVRFTNVSRTELGEQICSARYFVEERKLAVDAN